MLKESLVENIVLKKEVFNWQEAVEVAAKKMVTNGYIEERYITKMIENIEKLGPYIVLSEDVAMPHSRAEDGVKKTGIGLLKLEKGVSFGNDTTSIRLIFILAAKDSDSHIDMITELVDLLKDNDKVKKLLESKTEEEIIKSI